MNSTTTINPLSNRPAGAISPQEIERGATVVISHSVQECCLDDYEAWLTEIVPLCQSQPGHINTQIIRPIAGLTTTFTIIIRFDQRHHLEDWINSEDRRLLIAKITPLLSQGDRYAIRSGLDFLFAPEPSGSTAPVRWKQFLVTWSVIYPLVLGMPLLLAPIFDVVGLPENHYLQVLLTTGAIVSLMVYLIMPRYTKLVRSWLFR